MKYLHEYISVKDKMFFLITELKLNTFILYHTAPLFKEFCN